MTSHLVKMRKDAECIFHAGLSAVEPVAAIKNHCRLDNNHLVVGNSGGNSGGNTRGDNRFDLSGFQNIFVIGAGKAGAPMAAALEDILGNKITDGIIIVKYNHLCKTSKIKLTEAGHPIPDKNGQNGANTVMEMARRASSNDLVICLISGGGSALLPLPGAGLSLTDKQDTMQVLLDCGATIHEVNTIRKHISMIKGGRLAEAAFPATVITMILSDVVGDNLDVIASGPTVPDFSTFQDCLHIIKKYDLFEKLPSAVTELIHAGIKGDRKETPKEDSPVFEKTNSIIVGSNMDAIREAEKKATALGYNTLILSSMIQGETKHVACVHTAIAKEIRKTRMPIPTPACILSGGETTVTMKGSGKGGRNQEFALAAAIDIAQEKEILILSGGTDGTDGPTDAAGAYADTDTLKRASVLQMDPLSFLNNNDSYHFFEKTKDLFITGPTNTNVMDVRVMLVL
jgi:glycerate 2-kinase